MGGHQKDSPISGKHRLKFTRMDITLNKQRTRVALKKYNYTAHGLRSRIAYTYMVRVVHKIQVDLRA